MLVPTPESLATTSNPEGLADLQDAMARQESLYPGQPYLVEGYSQSAAITIDEKIQLLEAGQHPDVSFLLLGSLNRPDGGIYERFPGLDIPGLGGFFTYNGAEPTDAGIPTIDIVNQYDFFADFPQFPINPVADLNAVFGIIYAHAAYGDGPLSEQIPEIWPDSAPLSGPYADQYVLGSLENVMQQLQQQVQAKQQSDSQKFQQKQQLEDQASDNRIKRDITREAAKASGMSEAVEGEPSAGGLQGQLPQVA